MKTTALCCLLFCGALAAQAQTPTISPLNPAVNQGTNQTFTCTANCGTGGTWSCSGCAGSIVAGTGVYTAPASVTPQQSLGGYQLLPNNHIINTNVSGTALRSDSATLIAGAGSSTLNYAPSGPINYTNGSTPTDSLVFFYTPGHNGIYQIPAVADIRIENGWLHARSMGTEFNADHHIMRIDTTNGQVQEQYQYYPVGDALGIEGCALCNSQSGVKYSVNDYALPDSTTNAAGMEQTPLLMRIQEFVNACNTSGAVKHAIAFTLQNTFIHPAVLWPGQTTANLGSGPNFYGERVRLKANYAIGGFSSCAQVLLTQLKDYGMFLTDGGSGWQVNSEYGPWPENLIAAMAEVTAANIGPSNFEVVDDDTLKISGSSGETTNSREIVTYTASTGSVSTDVVTKGIAVGLMQDNLNFMSGTPAYQLMSNITGTNNTNLTWTMSPTVGSIGSTTGIYTAPATIGSVTSTTITATSVADGTVSSQMLITVWPQTGVYALPSSTTNYTDTGGRLWKAGAGIGMSNQPKNLACCAANYEGNYLGSVVDERLWWDAYSSSFTANDSHMDFLLPQGNYTLTFHAIAYPIVSTVFQTITAQGSTVANNVDFTASVGRYFPYTLTTTATVGSNNKLSFIEFKMSDFTNIASFSIEPLGNGIPSTIKPGVVILQGVTVR